MSTGLLPSPLISPSSSPTKCFSNNKIVSINLKTYQGIETGTMQWTLIMYQPLPFHFEWNGVLCGSSSSPWTKLVNIFTEGSSSGLLGLSAKGWRIQPKGSCQKGRGRSSTTSSCQLPARTDRLTFSVPGAGREKAEEENKKNQRCTGSVQHLRCLSFSPARDDADADAPLQNLSSWPFTMQFYFLSRE